MYIYICKSPSEGFRISIFVVLPQMIIKYHRHNIGRVEVLRVGKMQDFLEMLPPKFLVIVD